MLKRERSITSYDYQNSYKSIAIWVDTDYAGCRKTRKSTTGGVAILGNHLVKGWSTSQAIIALSVGEAEFYGMVKGGSIGLGIRSVLQDMGVEKKIKVNTDSSTAKGIAMRKGLGKVRHIEVNQLWIQDRVAKGDIELCKVPGIENLADALTKNVENEGLKWHMEMIHQSIANDRHELAPVADSTKDNEERKTCLTTLQMHTRMRQSPGTG